MAKPVSWIQALAGCLISRIVTYTSPAAPETFPICRNQTTQAQLSSTRLWIRPKIRPYSTRGARAMTR